MAWGTGRTSRPQAWRTGVVFSFLQYTYVFLETLQPWSIKLLARECFIFMDTQRDAHLLGPHNTTGGEDRTLDSSPALDLEDALPEGSGMHLPLGTEPGVPAAIVGAKLAVR
eukprot:5267002-Amphidinium_carterae.1